MLEDEEALQKAAEDCDPEIIIHLAAQAGVRYSLEHPEAYVSSNLVGTFNVMELARRTQAEALPARLDQFGLWRQSDRAVLREPKWPTIR